MELKDGEKEIKEFKTQDKAIDFYQDFVLNLNNRGKIAWVVYDSLFKTHLVKIQVRPKTTLPIR